MKTEVAMTTTSSASSNESLIRQRLESWANALRAKDLDGLMSHYANDVLVFDVPPPLRYEGAAAYRKNWADWFSSFRDPLVGYEIRDLNVTTGGDLAFCWSLNRITGLRTSGENTDVWVRATVALRRIGGRWMIVHEHISVPINMDTYQAEFKLKP
jgi:ketosteroid isomerase-like protein